MSDLLDDFIAFLEQDQTPQECNPTTSHVEEFDDTDGLLDFESGGAAGGSKPATDDPFGTAPDDDQKEAASLPVKGFALGAVKSSQVAYKSGMRYVGAQDGSSGGSHQATIEFLSMRITKLAVSADSLNKLAAGKRVIRLTEIPFHVNRLKKEIEGDWVTGGVVIDRQQFSSKKTGKLFTILKLSDLRETSKHVSLFLFGAVHEAFMNLSVCSVVGLLNPTLMPSNPNGKNSKTGSKTKQNNEEICALKLDHHLKLLFLGSALDFGRCKAEKTDGDLCNAVINTSLAKTCVFHVNREYGKVVSSRPDLKATYAGIIPQSEVKEIQHSTVDNNFALLGPGGVSSVTKDKIKAQITKATEEISSMCATEQSPAGPLQGKETQASRKAQKEAQLERKKQLLKELDLRKQLEAEMIADAVRNPLTLAARNLAKLHLMQKNGATCQDQNEDEPMTVAVARKKRSECSHVNLSEFSAADEIFSKLKPVRQEIISAPRPQLARGCGPGNSVFLDLDSADAHKQNTSLPRRAKGCSAAKRQRLITPFDVMKDRSAKSVASLKQSMHQHLPEEKDEDDIQLVSNVVSRQKIIVPVSQTEERCATGVVKRSPEPAKAAKLLSSAKKRKLDSIRRRVQGNLTIEDEAL